MTEFELLLAEIGKNMEIADRIRDFIDATELHGIAILGKTPATALMMVFPARDSFRFLPQLAKIA